jgi:sensor histidine kinase YesM
MKQHISLVKKIHTYVNNKSLRWRIMLCVIAAIVAMSISLVIIIRLDHYALEIIGNSYKSNTELNYFSHQLAEAEKSMETYFKYRTFESIDSYYLYQSKVESYRANMQDNPSTDVLLQKEYTVKQLSGSFSYYSGKAVAAKRANNEPDQTKYYTKTLECYNMLLSQLSELNLLLLENNATTYNENRKNISKTTGASIIFIILFFILILILLYMVITSITKPLAEISEVAHRLAERDFDVPLFNRDTHDEIGNITRAFDRMIISIREYIDTIWEKAMKETEMKEKEIEMQSLYADAQIRALQNQINPHFLFNTLNTGAQLAMMEGADKTCYFIEQVADFFRYNIQQQKEAVTIDEELGLVDNFVYIMKVRFGTRLEFTKQVPQRPLIEKLPSMTLQPLVENCIKHGLRNTTGKVMLKIEDAPGFTVISISDNGSGIPTEIRALVIDAVLTGKSQLPLSAISATSAASLNSAAPLGPTTAAPSTGNGTGLINVFSRLRLYFHRDDVFDITQNDEGQGTKFIIRIPAHV